MAIPWKPNQEECGLTRSRSYLSGFSLLREIITPSGCDASRRKHNCTHVKCPHIPLFCISTLLTCSLQPLHSDLCRAVFLSLQTALSTSSLSCETTQFTSIAGLHDKTSRTVNYFPTTHLNRVLGKYPYLHNLKLPSLSP